MLWNIPCVAEFSRKRVLKANLEPWLKRMRSIHEPNGTNRLAVKFDSLKKKNVATSYLLGNSSLRCHLRNHHFKRRDSFPVLSVMCDHQLFAELVIPIKFHLWRSRRRQTGDSRMYLTSENSVMQRLVWTIGTQASCPKAKGRFYLKQNPRPNQPGEGGAKAKEGAIIKYRCFLQICSTKTFFYRSGYESMNELPFQGNPRMGGLTLEHVASELRHGMNVEPLSYVSRYGLIAGADRMAASFNRICGIR